MDTEKAVASFLKHFTELKKLPFVSDSEMSVFGEEMNDAIQELDDINLKEGLCTECRSRCCNLVRCEFYHTELSLCPLVAHRPLLCRMHYCVKYGEKDKHLIKQIGDVFLRCISFVEDTWPEKAVLLDTPPFSGRVPAFTVKMNFLIDNFKSGDISESSLQEQINAEIRRFRHR